MVAQQKIGFVFTLLSEKHPGIPTDDVLMMVAIGSYADAWNKHQAYSM